VIGNVTTFRRVISDNGGYCVYESLATNLASPSDGDPGLGNPTERDVFLYDFGTDTSTLISHTGVSSTTSGNDASRNPTISADGAVVAFESDSTNLLSGQTDTNGGSDVFLFSRVASAALGLSAGQIVLVSHTASSTNTTGSGASNEAAINADGSVVAFA